MVQRAHIVLQRLVLVVAQQHPVQLFGFIPFDELTEFLPHKQQLFAGVCHHIAEESAQVRKFFFIVAGHFVQQAAFAVYDLVVADGQHKILAEGIEEAECHLAMVSGAEQRVSLHVAEHIVHPAHIPLEVEAQSPIGSRLGDQRPGGGFLGDHHLVRELGQDSGVQLLQESNRLQIFLAALGVLLPLAVLAVVVEIEHTCHGIHAQTVHMVVVHPEHSAGRKEAGNLVHSVVKDHCPPLFMLAAAGVGVLIAGGAVKHIQPVTVLGEVGGHPVQNNADAGLVQLIHQGHKILGGAVAAGRGKVAGDLIAPAAVKGVFGNGQQLHMGVAHIFYVRDQLVRQLGVVVRNLLFGILHLPAADLHLIDGHRTVDGVFFGLFGAPCGVAPSVVFNIVDLAAVGGAGLGMESVGVSLVEKLVPLRGDAVFIGVKFLDTRHEQFPDAVGYGMQRMLARCPTVKVAHQRYGFCVGRPYPEHCTGLTVLLTQMRTEIAICLLIVALFKQINRQIRGAGRLFALLQRYLPFLRRCCNNTATVVTNSILPALNGKFKTFL